MRNFGSAACISYSFGEGLFDARASRQSFPANAGSQADEAKQRTVSFLAFSGT
jgi:hypothetical protein